MRSRQAASNAEDICYNSFMSEMVNSSLKSTVKGTSIVFLGMVVSILLWFATKVLIIRNTSPEELGIYSIVVAVVGIASSVATLGLHEGTSRFVSIFLGEGNNAQANAISGAALRIGAVSGAVVFFLLFLLSGPIARYVFYKPEISYSLKVVAFFVPASVMVNIMIGVLRGYNVMKPRIFMSDIGQPLLFLVLISIFFLLRLPFISIIYAYSAAMAGIFGFVWIYGRKKIGLSFISTGGSGRSKELIKFSVPLLAVSILGIVLAWTDTIMLGRYAGEADVGVYNVSISLARLLSFPLGALEFVFMAIAGGMYAKKQHAQLKKVYQVLTRWNFSATLPIFSVLFFFPEMTIAFLFGDKFAASAAPLRILSIGFLFSAFLGVNNVVMLVMGMQKKIMHVSFFGTALNIVLNYLLIKQCGLGIIGSSIATAISYLACNVMALTFLYRESKIHPITANYLYPVASTMGITVIIYAIAKNLPLSFWMLPLYFLLFIAGYVLSLVLTKSIGREDVALLEAISKRTGLEMKLTRRIIGRFIRE